MGPHKGTGWIPQPDDANDTIYIPPADRPDIPRVDLRDSPLLQKHPYDQEQLSSCTANVVASALRFGKNAEGWRKVEEDFQPSRMHIYFNERLLSATNHEVVPVEQVVGFLEGDVDALTTPSSQQIDRSAIEASLKNDNGAQLRDGMKAIQKYGVCLESTWPYMTKRTEPEYEKYIASSAFYVPPEGSLLAGVKNIDPLLTYERILDNGELGNTPPPALIDHMEAALADGYPVAFGIHIPNNLPLRADPKRERQGLTQDFVYTSWLADDASSFKHALLAVGYDRERQLFAILNSWGADFGDKGYFYLPYRWFAPETGCFKMTKSGAAAPESIPRADDFWVIKSRRESVSAAVVESS